MSVVSQIARATFPGGTAFGFMFWVVQVTTFAILVLAANTSFQGFPASRRARGLRTSSPGRPRREPAADPLSSAPAGHRRANVHRFHAQAGHRAMHFGDRGQLPLAECPARRASWTSGCTKSPRRSPPGIEIIRTRQPRRSRSTRSSTVPTTASNMTCSLREVEGADRDHVTRSADRAQRRSSLMGGITLHDIIDDRFARKAIEKGADGIIAVAAGAGGHAGRWSPFALLQEIRCGSTGR